MTLLPTLSELDKCSEVPPRLTTAGVIKNARIFYFKSLTLLCAAIGNSSDSRLIQISLRQSSGNDGKYNTWYFNSGDHDNDSIDAKKEFHWFPVKHNPIYQWSTKPFKPICLELGRMVWTAETFGYLAIGCDGNKHRGPSVFAMFLCLAGYNPKLATQIANQYFGCNFVMPWVRERIARLGWELGNQDPQLRARAARLLEL